MCPEPEAWTTEASGQKHTYKCYKAYIYTRMYFKCRLILYFATHGLNKYIKNVLTVKVYNDISLMCYIKSYIGKNETFV